MFFILNNRIKSTRMEEKSFHRNINRKEMNLIMFQMKNNHTEMDKTQPNQGLDTTHAPMIKEMAQKR